MPLPGEGSDEMGQLPIINIGRKRYFLDERLNEMRNVKDPNDRESMEGSDAAFWEGIWGEKKKRR